MNKNYRIFVKNLPTHINEEKIKDLFQKYVTVSETNLKEKQDLDDKINKFAFVNINTTDKQLQACFKALNGKNIDGFRISVELAKESFLERLKKERNDNKLVQSKNSLAFKTEKTETFFNGFTRIKPKQQIFFDTDLLDTSYDEKEEKNHENLCNEFKTEQKIEEKITEADNYSNLKEESYSKKNVNDFFSAKKKDKTHNKINNSPNQLNSSEPCKEVNMSNSEKKRLMSLKQKKKVFKAQEQAIRNALKHIDNRKQDNRIVFDDNIDLKYINNISDEKSCNENKKKNNLFESEEEDEDFQWNNDELEAKSNLKEKLLKLQTNIGNDKRFILDERFIDDDNDEKKQENLDDKDPTDEKKWQLNILGNVLGKPIVNHTSDTNESKKRKSKMIRYDPTASNHHEFEITIQEPKLEKSVKKKQKICITEEQDVKPIPICKEVFYEVSETLADSLNKTEEFSLLKTFGKADLLSDISKNNDNHQDINDKQGMKLNYSDKRNPFKYDSSDNESNDEETNTIVKSNANKNIDSSQKNDRLFFAFNDSRFLEAEKFFKNQSAQDANTFKDRRRKLKEIVRSKIRNNLKKINAPWNKKKIRKSYKK